MNVPEYLVLMELSAVQVDKLSFSSHHEPLIDFAIDYHFVHPIKLSNKKGFANFLP